LLLHVWIYFLTMLCFFCSAILSLSRRSFTYSNLRNKYYSQKNKF
jgi:hypothetical protein